MAPLGDPDLPSGLHYLLYEVQDSGVLHAPRHFLQQDIMPDRVEVFG